MAPANQSKEGVLYLQIVFCFLFIIYIDIVIVTNITEFLVISLIYFHYSESPKTNKKKKKLFLSITTGLMGVALPYKVPCGRERKWEVGEK